LLPRCGAALGAHKAALKLSAVELSKKKGIEALYLDRARSWERLNIQGVWGNVFSAVAPVVPSWQG